MLRFLCTALTAAASLVLAAPAAAVEPTKTTTTVVLGPFIDTETCAFPITAIVERTRTTTTFANGDVQRHTRLIVTETANDKTMTQRGAFNVFIDADSPEVWVITGVFEKAQLHGRTIWLQSGRLLYDLEADQVIDVHPGPLAEPPDVCVALAP